MSPLEPGFYVATVEGVPDIPIMITDEGGHGWTMRKVPDTPYGTYGHGLGDFTDARPLITLDLADGARREYVLEILRAARHAWTHDVADQIEAQTKPARIPEPGLWGVVRASLPDDTTASSWVHIRGHRWYTEHHGCAAWDVLVYPTLERDGVES